MRGRSQAIRCSPEVQPCARRRTHGSMPRAGPSPDLRSVEWSIGAGTLRGLLRLRSPPHRHGATVLDMSGSPSTIPAASIALAASTRVCHRAAALQQQADQQRAVGRQPPTMCSSANHAARISGWHRSSQRCRIAAGARGSHSELGLRNGERRPPERRVVFRGALPKSGLRHGAHELAALLAAPVATATNRRAARRRSAASWRCPRR
jgi:hypothetical protein